MEFYGQTEGIKWMNDRAKKNFVFYANILTIVFRVRTYEVSLLR